jgi:hypothetical protein
MTDDTTNEESIDTPVEIFLDNYTYLGQDSEGYHHHADKKHARIIVCSDRGERVGDHGWYVQLDGDIDHVHKDDQFKFAPGLEDWADHVEDARGWTDRALWTCPELRTALHSGGLV